LFLLKLERSGYLHPMPAFAAESYGFVAQTFHGEKSRPDANKFHPETVANARGMRFRFCLIGRNPNSSNRETQDQGQEGGEQYAGRIYHQHRGIEWMELTRYT
jgi:hypothetical protein